jgi:hypothetical protein
MLLSSFKISNKKLILYKNELTKLKIWIIMHNFKINKKNMNRIFPHLLNKIKKKLLIIKLKEIKL